MSTLTVRITPHALQRYRERFDPGATEETVVAMVREATPAPAWVRKEVAKARTYKAGREAVIFGEAVFVIGAEFGQLVVFTVSPLEWYRSIGRARPPHARQAKGVRRARNRG